MGTWTRPLRRALDRMVDESLRERYARLRVPLNAYGYDRWGASRDDQLRTLALLRWFHETYFRVEAHGLAHVPEGGRALLVGNHSGQLAYDGMLVSSALFFDKEPPRMTRAMIERFFIETPVVGTLMTRMGQLTGIQENAERLLVEEEALVLVFPEGARGGGRVWADRYRVLGFSQGFLRLAMRTGAPIVPFAFIGGEEMCPSLSRGEPLAKVLGLPYLPLVPWGLPLPAPVKVHIHFGAPIRVEGSGDEEDEVILPEVRRVEHAVSELIARGLAERRGVFL
ncbi:MAG: acyltransferase family protein [Sandaracinaceae bacterium]|nr:acyltransferase family protein [Sandaracinaceae bacterium]